MSNASVRWICNEPGTLTACETLGHSLTITLETTPIIGDRFNILEFAVRYKNTTIGQFKSLHEAKVFAEERYSDLKEIRLL